MENEGYETIDLLEVLNAVRQHLLAVILTTVILAGVSSASPSSLSPRSTRLPP